MEQEPSQELRKSSNPSRRSFLKIMIAILSSLGAIIISIPLIGSFIGPSLQLKKRHFANATEVKDLPDDEPKDVFYSALKEDAYIRELTTRNVWAIKHSLTDVTVFSPICPHLGCRYNWHPKKQQFICPCHGSVFAKDGRVLGGPAPRPLDTLPTRIKDGDLYVEWERFKVGIAKKVRV